MLPGYALRRYYLLDGLQLAAAVLTGLGEIDDQQGHVLLSGDRAWGGGWATGQQAGRHLNLFDKHFRQQVRHPTGHQRQYTEREQQGHHRFAGHG